VCVCGGACAWRTLELRRGDVTLGRLLGLLFGPYHEVVELAVVLQQHLAHLLAQVPHRDVEQIALRGVYITMRPTHTRHTRHTRHARHARHTIIDIR
jgi:hypothetical protein